MTDAPMWATKKLLRKLIDEAIGTGDSVPSLPELRAKIQCAEWGEPTQTAALKLVDSGWLEQIEDEE